MAATAEQMQALIQEMQRMSVRLQTAEQAAADAVARVQQAEQAASALFTTRRCVDAEKLGQAIPWQGEELELAGLCPAGHSLSPGRTITKICVVCKFNCPRTVWSWECQRCDLDVCPACMAAFGPLVLEKPCRELT
eukprot:1826820-Amphidinium_carterae.1